MTKQPIFYSFEQAMQLADNGLSVKRESGNLVINRYTSIMELLMLTDNDKAASDWLIIPKPPIPTTGK